MNNWLYFGKIFHKRSTPKQYSFTYKLFYIRFDIDDIEKLNQLLFSVNKFNLFSFYTKDHGARDGSDLRIWAYQKLKSSGIHQKFDRIELQTFTRVLGFVFNPVSFWFCYEKDQVTTVIAEVNNTFGQTHSYVVDVKNSDQEKKLHVSPFFQIEGHYHFDFKIEPTSSFAGISYYRGSNSAPDFFGYIQGKGVEMGTKSLAKAFFTHPLMSIMVVFYIHFHALILYLKGIPFFGKNGIRKENSHV